MKKTILLLVLILLTSCTNYGKKISKNNTDLYYSKGVTKVEAEKVLNYLNTNGFIDGANKSVQLQKNNNQYIFKLIVDKKIYNSNKSDNVFNGFPDIISKALNNVPVDVHLTDNRFNTKKIFKFKDRQRSLMALKTEVRYTSKISNNEAQKLANYLIKTEFADDTLAKTILLDKENNAYHFKMVVGDTLVSENTEMLLRMYGKELSKNVFEDAKVIMHACDTDLKSVKKVE